VLTAIATKEDNFKPFLVFIHFIVKFSENWRKLAAWRTCVHTEVEHHKFGRLGLDQRWNLNFILLLKNSFS
jgi:hypothetical protein